VRADASGVDPGEVSFEGEIVDEETGFEVVSAVEEEVDVLGELQDVFGRDVGDDGFEAAGRIDACEFVCGGDGFGELGAEVVFIEEDLTLEVGEFDEVAVNESDVSNACADEGFGEDGAERADATDENAGVQEALLSCRADPVKEDLAAVAIEVRGAVTGHQGSQAVVVEERRESEKLILVFSRESYQSHCARMQGHRKDSALDPGSGCRQWGV